MCPSNGGRVRALVVHWHADRESLWNCHPGRICFNVHVSSAGRPQVPETISWMLCGSNSTRICSHHCIPVRGFSSMPMP